MKTPILMLAAAVLGLTGCASYGPVLGAPPYAAASVMSTTKAPYGPYLVDNRGQSLYVLIGTRGMTGMNRCSGTCLRAWPPAVAGRPTVPGAGIDPTKLTTVAGPAGAQLAYAGWPLYYYHRDRAPGDTTGQYVRDTWGTWYLLSPSGEPITSGY